MIDSRLFDLARRHARVDRVAIALACDASITGIGARLKSLVDDGKIERIRRGHYRLAGPRVWPAEAIPS